MKQIPWKRSMTPLHCCHISDMFSNTGMSLQISEVVSLRPLISGAVTSTPGSSPSSAATHTCPMCRFSTTCRLLLTQHIRRHHDNWPFACPHCDYRTHRSHDLKKHLRTHTGEKPYHCSLCPYQTSDPSNLSAHFKNRHSSLRVEDHLPQ
uniref:C2H2-type domain-containing protein n=1 Tax=Scylla olivacea TaxID=85551 RepID=A0A0P4WLX3_SCYOL